jgi:putative ABC transport system permease protein
MYIIQNALKNIGRNKGRNLLIGVIILAIMSATVVSLIINNTSGRIIDDYKTRFGSKVSLTPDLEQMYSEGQNFNRVTTEQYLAFAESELLSDSTFTAQVPAISDTVKAIDQDNGAQGGNIRLQGPNGAAQESPTMKIIGHSSITGLTEFTDGQRKIEEGRMFEAENEAIVSKEFAEQNGLSVGDKMQIDSVMGEGISYELTVSGIYLDSTSAYGEMPMQISFMNRRNEILTGFDSIMKTAQAAGGAVNVQATYYLKNPDMLPDFEEELQAKGLPESYTVSTDEASYKKVVGPVEAMRGIFFTFMIVVLILGSLILMLLYSIAIRERKYEIGVLRAMGLKKGKVALGLMSEALVIMAVCLVAGLGLGTVLSQPVADAILQDQVAAAEETNAAGGGGRFLMVGGQSNISNVSTPPISELNVGLDAATIAQIAVIALVLALLSSAVGIRKITKFEPINILMERN